MPLSAQTAIPADYMFSLKQPTSQHDSSTACQGQLNSSESKSSELPSLKVPTM